MATYNFDLLDLADGESGEAAVSVVVGKKKTEVAAAKVVAAADPAVPAAQEKPKFSHFAKLQHDEGKRLCQQEQEKVGKALRKLRREVTKLWEQPGNEARLKELSDEEKKLRLEQRKLKQKEETLVKQRETFYKENGITLPEEVKKDKSTSKGANADPGSNYNDANGNVSNNNDGGSCGFRDYGGNNDQYQTQACDGGVKAKPSSDAGTEPEHKVSSDAGTERGTNNVVPPSESEKSAGGAAQGGANNGQGATTRTRTKVLINGSEKRKKKNAKKNSGNEPEKVSKQDSKVDGLKKQADEHQALPVYPKEEEKKTLAEYEKIREEKKKSSEASKTEVRKVTAEDFEGMRILEKTKLDDEEAVIKAEKPKVTKEASKKEEVQVKGKEAAAKDGKPKKVTVSRQDLGFKQPRRVTYNAEDGSFTRRFDGPFQGGNRENSTSTETLVSGRGIENGKAARNEAGGNGGAPRGTYNDRGNGASRGDFSGSRDGYRGNGGYGYGRGNGGYGYGRGNGGHQGNGDYNQQQQQGGNVGRFHQERAGNGGYYPRQQQGGHYQRRPGNGTYHQQRGNSEFRRSPSPAPAPVLLGVEDLSKFPALSPPASARSAAPVKTPASALGPSSVRCTRVRPG